MPYVLGLTGSIGMGKSTTAQMFADLGVPVWDADATVHCLYGLGGAVTALIGGLFPDVIVDEAVSRARLRAKIVTDPSVLDILQTKVHPLVTADRAAFVTAATAPIVLLDMPLLFETGAQDQCDGVVVVSAPPDIQRQRVLDRGEMTEAEFEMILSRQMPDAEKRARATWVVQTLNVDSARAAVGDILQEITRKWAHA